MNSSIDPIIKMTGHYEFYKNGMLVGESQNVLTDGYFSRLVNKNLGDFLYAFLGTGTTPPANGDVGLENYINGSVKGLFSATSTNRFIDGSDYIAESAWSINYNAGDVIANGISEVGVLMRNTTSAVTNPGTVVDSRVLIRDGNGTVTTIDLTASDQLSVIFRLRTILPSTPVAAPVTIAGNTYTMTFEMLGFNNWKPALARTSLNDITNIDRCRVGLAQPLKADVTDNSLISGNDKSVTTVEALGSMSLNTAYEVPLNAVELAAGVEYLQMFGWSSASTSYVQFGLHFAPKITDPTAQTIYVTLQWLFGRG